MSICLEGLKPHGILSRRLLVILLSIWADILIHLSPGCTRYSNCTVLIRWIEWKSVGKCTFPCLIQSEWTSNCAFWKILVYLKYLFYCLFHSNIKLKESTDNVFLYNILETWPTSYGGLLGRRQLRNSSNWFYIFTDFLLLCIIWIPYPETCWFDIYILNYHSQWS